MNGGVVVIAEHVRGEIADITLEMLACGRRLADVTSSTLRCVVLTDRKEPFQALPLAADEVIIVEDAALAGFNPDAWITVLRHLLKDLSPRLVLAGNTQSGSDVAAPLASALGAVLVSGCVGFEAKDGTFVVTSQLCGGKLRAISELPSGIGIVLLMPGSFPREEGMTDKVPPVQVRGPPQPLTGLKVAFKGYVEPEAEDVDITKAVALVGAGRGIQGKENLEVVEALAAELGGATCASRPVVDQGWLPRSRQVGRSGVLVKPRLYLALGISGAPEHVEGMRDSELIVAVNTDEGAPIFEVAQFGATVDLLELVPILIEKLKAAKGGK